MIDAKGTPVTYPADGCLWVWSIKNEMKLATIDRVDYVLWFKRRYHLE